MSENKSIAQKIANAFVDSKVNTASVDNLERQFEGFYKETIELVGAQFGKEASEIQQVLDSITTYSRKKDTLRSSIKTARRDFHRLHDIKRQLDWATTWDHAKALVFRIISVILIAVVVVLTAYVAKGLDIIIPTVRIGM